MVRGCLLDANTKWRRMLLLHNVVNILLPRLLIEEYEDGELDQELNTRVLLLIALLEKSLVSWKPIQLIFYARIICPLTISIKLCTERHRTVALTICQCLIISSFTVIHVSSCLIHLHYLPGLKVLFCGMFDIYLQGPLLMYRVVSKEKSVKKILP